MQHEARFIGPAFLSATLFVAGCVGFPTSIVSDHTEVPGLLERAVANAGEGPVEISAFLIHGMGDTRNDYHLVAAEMFAGALGVDVGDSTRFTEKPRVVVCLGRVEGHGVMVRAEAWLGREGAPFVKAEDELHMQHPAPGTLLGHAAPGCGPNVVMADDGTAGGGMMFNRFGSLSRVNIDGTWRDPDGGRDFDVRIKLYAYWWDGDAEALELPFIGYDSNHLCRGDSGTSLLDCPPGQVSHRRAWLNGRIKRGTMDWGLSDAALYAGPFGDVMREGTRNALCLMLFDERASLDELDPEVLDAVVSNPCSASRGSAAATPMYLLTQSLGSRILFDALEVGDTLPGEGADGDARDEVVERAAIIYMSANQLPLLGLASLEVDFGGEDRGDADTNVLLSLLRRGERSDKCGTPERPALIAFYDRNDLLGYRAGEHLPERARGCVYEIDQSYQGALLGLLTSMEANHDKSFVDDEARRIVMCGATQPVGQRRLRARPGC